MPGRNGHTVEWWDQTNRKYLERPCLHDQEATQSSVIRVHANIAIPSRLEKGEDMTTPYLELLQVTMLLPPSQRAIHVQEEQIKQPILVGIYGILTKI